MGLVIGVDEAGYGPNLGPLVVSVTVWEVPGEPAAFDFWKALRRIVTNRPPRQMPSTDARPPAISRPSVRRRAVHRLHVGDSKQVYSPAIGLEPLETSVLSLLAGVTAPATFAELWRHLAAEMPAPGGSEPWFDGEGLGLPVPLVADGARIERLTDRLRHCCADCGLILRRVRSDVVLTERFNHLTNALGGKAEALSRITLELLKRSWDPVRDGPAVVIADKHGGRNYYRGLVADVFCDTFPLCLDEGRSRSRYRLHGSELRFEARAERHFPVAVASMVSKYVRELAMEAFNRYWQRQQPGVRPTKGYPRDAHRFRREIAATQKRLGIPDVALWRER